MGRLIVRDGLYLLRGKLVHGKPEGGSAGWRWWVRNRRKIHGQPPLPKPPPHEDGGRVAKVVSFAQLSLEFRGRFYYTMTSARSVLFHRKPGDFKGAWADCSQYVSAVLHWVGVKVVTEYDDTATLLTKGKLMAAPAVGRVVVWGPGGGTHTAFVTEKAPAGDWWTVGFGHMGGPDRVLLSNMNAYFADRGEPGVRFLNFL